MKFIYLLVLLSGIGLLSPAWAQSQVTIEGKIVDLSTNEPLPGVNVLAKGTTTGTVTDIDGNYRLTVDNGVTTLIFSSIGYERIEEAINGRSTINLVLAPDIQSLSEVVVIGYGTQEKEDLTGSVATLEVDDVNKVGLASPDQILQGRVAGVNVKQASSAPGGLTSVRIRGSNSFTGSNEPLYVIDGVPVFNDAQELQTYSGPGTVGAQRINPQNPLAFLNPNDIASISVLKDASATAIYGARGSNGVIIITTKRGETGQANIDFNAYYGVQNLGHKPDLMTARELALYNEQHVANPGSREQEYYFDAPPSALGEGTDWLEVITRENAPIQDYNLGVSGGNDLIRYAIGGNYFNQAGLVQNSSLQRYSLRVNLDADISDRLTVGNSLVATRTANNFAWVDGTANGNFGMGSVMAAMGTLPSLTVFDEDGNYNSNQRDASSFRAPYITNSPLAILEEHTDLRKTNRVLANLYASYNLLDNLTFRISLGADVEARDNTAYYTRELLQGPRLITSSANRENFINENTLNYSLVRGDHTIDALAGFSVQQQDANSFFFQEVGFPFDRLGADAQGQGEVLGAPSSRSRWSMVSYLGRINYEYQGKYLVTGSVRADGSSRFAENRKWGVFPSAAVAWRVSEEPFLQDNRTLSNLKIRASAGTVGNTEIGTNQSVLQISDTRYSFGGNPVTAFFPSSTENEDLKWEQTTQYDLGIDLGLLNNRLSLTADVYYKTTTDLLVFVPVPTISGFSSALLNIGEMENRGVDLMLTGNWTQNENFSWTTNLNYSVYRNKVLAISPGVDEFFAPRPSERGEYQTLVKVGEPIGVFSGFATDGIYQSQQDIDNSPSLDGAAPGDIRFVDSDGDGAITNDDRTVIGNPHPDFTFGITNEFRYKIVDVSFLFSGSIGNDIFNTTSFHLKDPRQLRTNKYAALLDSWTPDNPNAQYPRAGSELAGNFIANDILAVEDGSFVRLQNVTVGVNIPGDVLRFGRSLRLYVTGQNVFTWTDYLGINPEVNSAGQSTTNLGADTGGYPLARTFMFGINLGL